MTTLTTTREPVLTLGRRTRKALLAAHIATAGAWIGLDVVMGVLIFRALGTSADGPRGIALQALEMVATWPLIVVSMLCLATGIVLGLGTRFGLLRYWWVIAKLVATVILCTLVLVLLQPGVTAAADYGRDLLTSGAEPGADLSQLVFPPIVSTTVLVAATYVAVAKPWGRRGRHVGRAAAAKSVLSRSSGR